MGKKQHIADKDKPGWTLCGVQTNRINPKKDMATCNGCRAKADLPQIIKSNDPEVRADWSKKCMVCGQGPVLPLTGMCGPCTFDEAETFGGNW